MKRSIFVIVLVVVFASRLPMILSQPKYHISNTDELNMTLATLDRLLGVPYIHSAWPAGTLQMISLPVIAVDFVWHAEGGISAATLATYVSKSYRDPWRILRLQKLIVAVLASVGVAVFAVVAARIGQSQSFGVVAAIVLASAPVFWHYSGMAMADTIAVGLLCLACWMCLGIENNPHKSAMIGAVFGLAMASKLTVVLALPFLLALYFSEPNRKNTQDMMLGALGVMAGFVLACPYVWIEPVRFVKTVLANSTRSGTPLGLTGSLSFIGGQLGLGATVLALLGIFGLGVEGKFRLVLGVAGSLVGAIFIFSRAGVVHDRYLLPLTVPLAYAAASGCGWGSRSIGKLVGQRFSKLAVITVPLIALVILFQNTVVCYAVFQRRAAELAKSELLFQEIQQEDPNISILMPCSSYMLTRMAGQLSQRSLQAMASRISRDPADIMMMEAASSLDPITVIVFGSNFNGWEQALGARLRALSATADQNGRNIIFWSAEPWLAHRFGLLTRDEAQALYQEAKSALWIDQSKSAPGDAMLFTLTRKPTKP